MTINKCTEALYIDDKLTKAYFLRAQAKSKLKNYDEAITDIKEAIKLSPGDKALRDEFEAIKALKKKESDAEKTAAQNLFAKGLYNEKKAPVPSAPAPVAKKFTELPEFDIKNP